MSRFEGRITVPEAVVHQRIEDETVLLHLGTERYFGLDEVGTRVWQLLEERRDLDAIMVVLLEEYDVDETSLRDDVERLLRELDAAGLIEVEPARGA